MTQLHDAKVKIVYLVDLLRSTGGLQIDAEIEESVQPHCDHLPIAIHLSGQDAALFVHNDGELLKALHDVAAAALHLDGHDHELLWFDVDYVRADRQRHILGLAESEIAFVHET